MYVSACSVFDFVIVDTNACRLSFVVLTVVFVCVRGVALWFPRVGCVGRQEGLWRLLWTSVRVLSAASIELGRLPGFLRCVCGRALILKNSASTHCNFFLCLSADP